MNNPLTQVVFIQRVLLFMNQNNNHLKEAPSKKLPDDPQQLVRDTLRFHQLPLLYVTSSWTECIEEFETFALWWRSKILSIDENENKIHVAYCNREDTFRVLFYILCRFGNPWLLKQVIEMIPKLVSLLSSSRNKPQLRTMSKFPDSSSSSEDEDENIRTTSSSSRSPLLVSHLTRMERKVISRYLSEFRFEKLDMMRVDGTFSFFLSREKLDDDEENTSTTGPQVSRNSSHSTSLLTSSDKPTSLAQVLYSFNKQRANNVSTDAQVRDRALPLHVCAMHGNTDCCRVLIEFAKVDIDHVSNASKSSSDASKTALWYAVKYRHVETVKYLFCEAGALLMPHTRPQQIYLTDSPLFVLFNDDDTTDIEKSQEEKRKKQEILDIILEPSLQLVECFTKVTSFYAAAVKCLPELLEEMFCVAEKSQELKEKIVNPRLTFGYSQSIPLHACINGGLPESKVLPTLRLLLTKLGCSSEDIKAFIRTSVDSTGDTVAHAAAKRGYALCLNMIFDEFYPELCYDFLTRDDVTTSAPPLLHCAAINGHVEVCQLLAKKCPELLFLERKLATTDEKATTPREWANRSRHTGKKVGVLLANLEKEYRAEYMKKAEALERRNDFASSSSSDDGDGVDE